MKKFKQFIAFVLTLCMLFSLSVAAFAAEADEHTIYDSAPDEEPEGNFLRRRRENGCIL